MCTKQSTNKNPRSALSSGTTANAPASKTYLKLLEDTPFLANEDAKLLKEQQE